MTLANSGLPYPIRAGGDHTAPVELPGVPLGSFYGTTYDEVSFPLQAGDLYVFCSDGISEAMNENGEEFGASRLLDVVARSRDLPPADVIGAINAAVEEHRAGYPANDDMTVVVVKLTVPGVAAGIG